jgi:hypothetical protein
MFSLKDTLASRKLPPGYSINMGIRVLCGRPPVSITTLRNSSCPESVIIHFKSLLSISQAITNFFNKQFTAMQRLFAEGGVAVLRGTTEDLSGNQSLAGLLALDVGSCVAGTLTQDQKDLYANRNNVGTNEIVVYLVQSMVNGSAATNFVGCAAQQSGQGPGAAVIQVNADWLVSHEVGHVLGLSHVSTTPTTNSDFLMWPNVSWTNVPPDLAASEYTTMVSNSLTKPC